MKNTANFRGKENRIRIKNVTKSKYDIILLMVISDQGEDPNADNCKEVETSIKN